MTKPFERNNPMPGKFDQTCEYIVKLLKPVIKPKSGGKEAGGGGSIPGGGAKKEKKEKKEKQPQPPQSDEDPFVKAKLVVAKVVDVAHVENSDKLYLCKVQIGPGEEDVKQVVTGLRKFVPEEELRGRKVLCILNLKVAKLAGQTSEAMILATEATIGEELSVKLVNVPDGADVGDAVGAEGIEPAATYPKECKSKFWDAVKTKLTVRGGKATYDGKIVGCAAGACFADASVLDGSFIK